MVRIAIAGLGKMGLSHQAIVNAHPDLELVAVCDVTDYVLGVLSKYAKVRVYRDFAEMLAKESLDALLIATPSAMHASMVQAALEKNLHIFCEKPFCLEAEEGLRFAQIAEEKGLITQVGYHFRFVGTFVEMKRLIEAGAIGKVHHLRAEAYGPVVVRPQGLTWRSKKGEGGGCLYDYACHAIDLLNFLAGSPSGVRGSVLNKVFSNDVDDEAYSTLLYPDGIVADVAANWSDESFRKMSMKVTAWGTEGRITADRQEMQIYARSAPKVSGLRKGWNVKYTTDLTEEVWYYLRGEEYSAQIDHFVNCIRERIPTRSPFRSAADTDRITDLIAADARGEGKARQEAEGAAPSRPIWSALVQKFRTSS